MNKIIKKHSNNNWVKNLSRYFLIDYILDSNSWIDLGSNLKKIHNKDYPATMERIFNEFKFYNCIFKIEHSITGLLNSFLIRENKIKDWKVLKNKFLYKIKRNTKSTREEAEEIMETQINGKIKRILTPDIMLYCAGFGVGELVDYVNSFTKNFHQKKELIAKLIEFNKCRKLVIHNLLTSREDVGGEIEKGILLGKEIISLIEEISLNKTDEFASNRF